MKAKIDLEKFICSYIKWNNIQDALKDQGLKCCNDEIIKIPQENEDKQKFRKGDWIISKYMHLVMQILNNDKGTYETVETDGTERYDSYDFIERNFKLWTIANAKPGDVLVSKHNQPFIYNGIFDEESIGAYCGIDKLGNDFLIDTFSCDWSYKEEVKPATQEQRDILFMKMKDAGYEFDFEKKKLKKIVQKPNDRLDPLIDDEIDLWIKENSNIHHDDNNIVELMRDMAHYVATLTRNLYKQKPAWSEEDDAYKLFAISAVEDYYDKKNPLQKDLVDWLKSFKDRVQPQPKQEWSEADEKMVKDIIAAIDTLYYHGMVNWLKSLKDRIQPKNIWKPSKEQIIALRWVLNNIPYNKHKEEISGLLDQIKDL